MDGNTFTISEVRLSLENIHGENIAIILKTNRVYVLVTNNTSDQGYIT